MACAIATAARLTARAASLEASFMHGSAAARCLCYARSGTSHLTAECHPAQSRSSGWRGRSYDLETPVSYGASTNPAKLTRAETVSFGPAGRILASPAGPAAWHHHTRREPCWHFVAFSPER